jgi:thiamine pyrophosphokinase
MSFRAIIFANGSLPDPEPARRLIGPSDLLIAADGGARHILALELAPHVILGDLDSLPSDVDPSAFNVIRYPRDKNETDLELALGYAIEQGCTQIVVLAALGGRLDQTLGNLSLLTAPRFSALDVRLDDGVEAAFFVREQAEVRGRAGDIVSLIPWGADVSGVCTAGLRWPLDGETLYAHQTRGISNEMLGESATVCIMSGLLLLVHRRLSTNR